MYLTAVCAGDTENVKTVGCNKPGNKAKGPSAYAKCTFMKGLKINNVKKDG